MSAIPVCRDDDGAGPAVNQGLYPHLEFDPVTDFAPVALVASVQIVLAVNPQVKASDVRGLIALAKASTSFMCLIGVLLPP